MEIRVGEIIKLKREEKKISLIDFAKKVGVSPGYLSQIENGRKSNPKLEILLSIVSELDIDIDMILGLTSPGESLHTKIPSLLKLVLVKDRNYKVLEDKEVLKKMCNIIDKALECRYLIDDPELYEVFLEDIYIQIETIIKRYMAIEIVRYNKKA